MRKAERHDVGISLTSLVYGEKRVDCKRGYFLMIGKRFYIHLTYISLDQSCNSDRVRAGHGLLESAHDECDVSEMLRETRGLTS